MKVGFRASFAKDLKGVKDKNLLGRVRALIEGVERADTLADITGLKKLKGGGSYYRLRAGDYRVGLAVENDTVIFVRLLDRKDIYKRFP